MAKKFIDRDDPRWGRMDPNRRPSDLEPTRRAGAFEGVVFAAVFLTFLLSFSLLIVGGIKLIGWLWSL